MSDSSSPERGSQPLLSFRDAAALTGLPRREIRARVRRGEIAVRVLGKGRSAKLRLTPRALVEANLLGPDLLATSSVTDDTPARLLNLIHDQGARITALEDQRFQLAGQLGAAIERARALEEQMRALTAPRAARDPRPRSVTDAEPRDERNPRQRSDLLNRDPAALPRARNQRSAEPTGVAPATSSDTIVATAMRDALPATAEGVLGPEEASRARRAGALLRRGASRLLRPPGRGTHSTR